MIRALIEKDIKLYFRNRFFAVITGLGLAFYLLVYLLLPDTVDETLSIALYIEHTADIAAAEFPDDGLEVAAFDSPDALIDAVESGDYMVGLVLTAAALDALEQGESAAINVYYAPGTPEEMRNAVNLMLVNGVDMLTTASGARGGLTDKIVEILGPVPEAPIPMRDRMVPTLLLAILAVEVMGMATLIVEEIEHRTAHAVLITPLSTSQFLTSKAIMGMGLAFVQVLIIVVVTGKIGPSPLLVLVALLMGSLLITGLGFLIASVAKDMLSVISYGMVAVVILVLPSLTIIFPAIGSGWMEYIPSYYLVDTVHKALNFDTSWGDVATNLLILLALGMFGLLAGGAVLRRRVQ